MHVLEKGCGPMYLESPEQIPLKRSNTDNDLRFPYCYVHGMKAAIKLE